METTGMTLRDGTTLPAPRNTPFQLGDDDRSTYSRPMMQQQPESTTSDLRQTTSGVSYSLSFERSSPATTTYGATPCMSVSHAPRQAVTEFAGNLRRGPLSPATEIRRAALMEQARRTRSPPISSQQNHQTTSANGSTISVNDINLMVKPFSGTAKEEQFADKWLHSFELYANFKNLNSDNKINLFKLMLTDQAAAWLMALPRDIANDWSSLLDAFHQRYGLTEAQKWRCKKDIWSRVQGETESVDDYVTTMQITANRINMSEQNLLEAIIQGLKPELRLFVLNSQADNIQSLLAVARTCEAARSADPQQSTNLDQLTAMVTNLLSKVDNLSQPSTKDKQVSFAQSVVDTEQSQPVLRQHQDSARRSPSPRRPVRMDKSPSRFSHRNPSDYRSSGTNWSSGDCPLRREDAPQWRVPPSSARNSQPRKSESAYVAWNDNADEYLTFQEMPLENSGWQMVQTPHRVEDELQQVWFSRNHNSTGSAPEFVCICAARRRCCSVKA